MRIFPRIKLQLDQNDCGPACIYSLIRHYGKKVSIARIRQLAGTDLSGTSGRGMIKSLKYLGFNTKGIKAKNLLDLNNYPLPIIAHIKSNSSTNHYVIIFKIKKDILLIGDPLKGILKINSIDFFRICSGLFLIAIPTDKFKDIKNTNIIYNIISPLLLKYKNKIIIIILFTLFSSILSIVNSFYIKLIIDNINIKRFEFFNNISIAFLLLLLLLSLIDYIRQKIIVNLSKDMDIHILSIIYEKIINLPLNYFKIRKTGEITTRIDDAIALRDLVSTTIISSFIDILMITFGAITLIKINYKLFLSSLIPIILYIVNIILFNKIIRLKTKKLLDGSTKLKSKFLETINGIDIIKNFILEDFKIKEIKHLSKNSSENSASLSKIISLQITIQTFIKNSYKLILLWIGVLLIIQNRITLGYLLTFNTLLEYFISPIERLVKIQPKIQNVSIVSERLLDILDTEEDKDYYSLTKKINEEIILKKLSGNIIFNNVNFRYGERDLILSDFSLIIDSNKVIGIVGESGSGKTTIANLLLNLFDFEKGEILFDDLPITKIPKKILRRNIGYVSQETFLFNESIKDNFLSTDIEEIKHLCISLGLSDFIKKLPDGYNTILQENGSNLSGGQRQKISIIRALLKKPKILILDEASSNLDTISESKLDELISKEFNITVIKIAHRLTTIKNSDKIFVIDKGSVYEEGTHEELIIKKGKYFELWSEQSENFKKRIGINENISL